VWARAVVQAATVLALGIASGARPSAWIVALFSAPALLLISYYANLDAIAAAGVLLPPAGGLLLLAAKPQAAGLAVVVWLAQGKWRSFAPAVLVIALSTLLWSEWTLRVQESVAGALNISLFPYSLLAAAPLLVIAVRKNDPLLAAVITPLVVPYVAFYSVAPAIALLARRHLALGIAGNVLSWGILWLLVERLAAAR
jgi:hypothetical protein